MQKLPSRNKILRSKIKIGINRGPDKKCLDALWRKVTILKAGARCEYPNCHKTDYLNVHHFFSRSRMSVRWDIDNALVLCAGHHSLGNDSAHKGPMFKDTIIAAGVRSEEWLRKLTLRANTPMKVDRKLVYIDLTHELKKYD